MDYKIFAENLYKYDPQLRHETNFRAIKIKGTVLDKTKMQVDKCSAESENFFKNKIIETGGEKNLPGHNKKWVKCKYSISGKLIDFYF